MSIGTMSSDEKLGKRALRKKENQAKNADKDRIFGFERKVGSLSPSQKCRKSIASYKMVSKVQRT
jgi:hypothetical protein